MERFGVEQDYWLECEYGKWELDHGAVETELEGKHLVLEASDSHGTPVDSDFHYYEYYKTWHSATLELLLPEIKYSYSQYSQFAQMHRFIAFIYSNKSRVEYSDSNNRWFDKVTDLDNIIMKKRGQPKVNAIADLLILLDESQLLEAKA